LAGEQVAVASPVLLCATPARYHLKRLLEPFLPKLVVLSPGRFPPWSRCSRWECCGEAPELFFKEARANVEHGKDWKARAKVQPQAYAAWQDKEERDRILLEQLPQVRYLARRIHERLPRHVPLEDLVHAGVIGLIDALNKFDRSKHVQFGSYAKFRIRGAILDSLREMDWGRASCGARRAASKRRSASSAWNSAARPRKWKSRRS
jgi:hypothetical protein